MKAYLTLLLFSSCQIALGTEDCSQCIDGIATIMDIHKSNNDFIKIDAAFLKILCPTYRTYSFCQDDGKVAFWEAAAWTNDIYEIFCNSVESCKSLRFSSNNLASSCFPAVRAWFMNSLKLLI